MRKHLPTLVAALLLASTLLAAPDSAFDPARHMPVSEVRAGMKGYGLSVFSGTRIDRFEVEVISVLHNFAPRQDVILIRTAGCNLEHTGAIAGMSGSPIYLRDDAGRDRLVGAFAYGWPMMKDPVAGVQPIEYMLGAPVDENAAATQPGASGFLPSVAAIAAAPRSGATWNVGAALQQMRRQFVSLPSSAILPTPRLAADSTTILPDPTQLKPLQTPLMVSGIPATLLPRLSSAFASSGLVLLQAGAASAPSAASRPAAPFSPGSVLAVPLLTGDVEMTAVGTCTEVLGDRVYGFGHPFTSEGPVRLPMGSGTIQGVIANLTTSFKIGAMDRAQGTLLSDRAAGVAGKTGAIPPTAPITFHVRYADEPAERVYHYNAAIHPRFTSMLAATSLATSLSATREIPSLNTLEYDLSVTFAGGRSIRMRDRVANAETSQMVMEISLPLLAASVNPYERVLPEKIDGSVVVTPGTRLAQIVRAQASVRRYAPGEKIRLSVTLRQFRGLDVVQPVEIDIPRDLPDGTYQLSLSGKDDYLAGTMALEPFRMTATNIDDVFAALNDIGQLRSDAIYARLTLQPEGIALGRTPLPNLPASARHVLASVGRSDITAYTLTRTQTLPVDYVVQGSADFQIDVDRKALLDTTPRRSSRPPAASPANPPAPRPARPPRPRATDLPTDDQDN